MERDFVEVDVFPFEVGNLFMIMEIMQIMQIMEEMRMILQKSLSEMDKLVNKAKKGMWGLEKLVANNNVDTEVSLLLQAFELKGFIYTNGN